MSEVNVRNQETENISAITSESAFESPAPVRRHAAPEPSRGLRKDQLPYERFMERGAESLTDAELVAIILRTGTKDLSATELAARVLELKDPQNPSLLSLYDLRREDLETVHGIGSVRAVKLLALAEISLRMNAQRHSRTLSFREPSTIAAVYMERLRHKKSEHAILLLLDSRLCLIREVALSVGSAEMTVLPIRRIFEEALHDAASGIVLLHNHPSGDPTPSEEDLRVTERIAGAGKLLDIPLLDHLIIGDLRYTSMQEEGYLP